MPNDKDAPRSYVESSSTTLLDAIDRLHNTMEATRDYYRTIAAAGFDHTVNATAVLMLAEAVDTSRLLMAQALSLIHI